MKTSYWNLIIKFVIIKKSIKLIVKEMIICTQTKNILKTKTEPRNRINSTIWIKEPDMKMMPTRYLMPRYTRSTLDQMIAKKLMELNELFSSGLNLKLELSA
ncbi:uncharacterized protein LOC131995026 [Stomoxys calcitrans]|uniref:uncharacterized protein LOC131995026 n=1 Tax=Stomoxys calcitrans TaxID=35570 RepID=UPI0027E336B1|nr:uncharacterized protein LOC131995026 [Stomoxys calcitrans]XP_059218569.1 uncharacterized protein LOC131995026 [Stomoxys calcitrans]